MTWHQGLQDGRLLRNLSFLTVRLMRIATYQKVARGEAQLKSYGLPAELTAGYRKYARDESLALATEEPDQNVKLQLVRFIPSKGNTF